MPTKTTDSGPRTPEVAEEIKGDYARLLLSLADDALMLGHVNSDWTGLGPTLEEDIAFSALAQDDIAHAQAFFQYLESLTGTRADDLAFGRAPADYRSAAICERGDDFDWAIAIARQFLVAHFEELRLGRLAHSKEPVMAGLAKRLLAEQQIQIEHADGWMRRLANDADAKARVERALATLARDAVMLAEPVEGEDRVAAAGLYPEGSRPVDEAWRDQVTSIARTHGYALDLPAFDPEAKGGRRGAHGDRRTEVLDEMCEVYREDPGASW